VNNPSAIRAWERAARWVGSISPPTVVEYLDPDAYNMWQAGHAAFMRNWSSRLTIPRRLSPHYRPEVAPLPLGAARRAATLGGNDIGVSRRSPHPREAATLVRFLTGYDAQLRRAVEYHIPPGIVALYDDPRVVAANPQFAAVRDTLSNGVVVRPSAPAGQAYPDVSRAYVAAVHAVIARQTRAPQAAADLEAALRRVALPRPVR
jgi:trehalose/maltose transport system substrate-binding protein